MYEFHCYHLIDKTDMFSGSMMTTFDQNIKFTGNIREYAKMAEIYINTSGLDMAGTVLLNKPTKEKV